jgi:hypothetical protein
MSHRIGTKKSSNSCNRILPSRYRRTFFRISLAISDSMATSSSKRLVHPSTLLRMFKDVGYEKAILEKQARAGTPFRDTPGPTHQPKGTRSQSVPYSLMGIRIAVCHQYTLPDGRFGASQKPDPKMIQYRGHQLYCHSQPCPCTTCNAAPEGWNEVLRAIEPNPSRR